MNQAPPIFIKASPSAVYHGLLSPVELSAWWQCAAVVDARVGGLWAVGWSPDENGPGHGVVMSGVISQLEPDSVVAIHITPITILFRIQETPGGVNFLIEQYDHPDPASAEAGLQTWVAAMQSMKTHVETANPTPAAGVPTVNVWDLARQAAAANLPKNESLLDSRGSRSGLYAMNNKDLAHPVDRIPESPSGDIARTVEMSVAVQDDGGFGVTDPWAEVVSWKKEQGFGYALHPELGEVMFDYDGCDFEPAVGDRVLLLQLKKAWNGKPKCKRIACPAKGSNASK